MAPRRPWRARRAWKPFSSHVWRSLGHFSQKIIPQVMVHQTRIISPSFTIQKTRRKHSPLELAFAQNMPLVENHHNHTIFGYKWCRWVNQSWEMSSYVQINHGHQLVVIHPMKIREIIQPFPSAPQALLPSDCLQQPLEKQWISHAAGVWMKGVASFCLRRTTMISI